MGLFGPPNIARLEARRKIPRLIKALDYRGDSWVRCKAARALANLGAVEAVDRLAELCKWGDSEVAPAAIEALARLAEASADAGVGSRVIDALIRALEASDSGQPSSPPRGSDDFEAYRSRARWESSRPIYERVWDEGVYRRMLAAQALGRFRDARAVDPLLACLRNHHFVMRDFHTRRAAAESLRHIGDPRAIPGLEASLQDGDEGVRQEIRMAILSLDPSRDRS